VGSNERLSALKVTASQQNDFKASLVKIGKEEAAQLIECCFADHSRPDFGGEDRLDLDQRKLGNDQSRAGRLNQRLHPFTPDPKMVQLCQSDGVNEVAGHLTFVPFSEEVRVQ